MKRNYDHEFHGVELGSFGEDIVTGFRGVVTGMCLHLTGCAQACLTPKIDDKGKREDAAWFDITRIKIDVAQAAVELIQSSTVALRFGAPSGGGEAPPTR